MGRRKWMRKLFKRKSFLSWYVPALEKELADPDSALPRDVLEEAMRQVQVMKAERREIAFMLLFSIVVFVLLVLYARWQFNLCYPEVSDSVWYCLQHAAP